MIGKQCKAGALASRRADRHFNALCLRNLAFLSFLPDSSHHLKMPQAKRAKLADEPKHVDAVDDDLLDEKASGSENSSHATNSESESLSTEEEIMEAERQTKSKKTQKRKRRATSPTRFGSTLLSLLDTDTPAPVPFALKPSVEKRRARELSEVKSKKASDLERKEKEEKGHIQDVIGGWGAERERSLRKVAQRGGEYQSTFELMCTI